MQLGVQTGKTLKHRVIAAHAKQPWKGVPPGILFLLVSRFKQ